jgi:hypothetical protein
MNAIMENEYVEGAGYTSLIATAFLAIANLIGKIEVNELLQFVTAFFALIFLYYKIKGQILDNKIKRQTLKDHDENNK